MAKVYENECVDCGLPCIGEACPHRKVLKFYCDECDAEAVLYHYEDKELCIDCIKDTLEKVE